MPWKSAHSANEWRPLLNWAQTVSHVQGSSQLRRCWWVNFQAIYIYIMHISTESKPDTLRISEIRKVKTLPLDAGWYCAINATWKSPCPTSAIYGYLKGYNIFICRPELHLSQDLEVTVETAAVQSQSRGALKRPGIYLKVDRFAPSLASPCALVSLPQYDSNCLTFFVTAHVQWN